MSAVFSITSADKARLAASDLPSRVRELLGALIGLCRQTLAAPLILTVEALEQTLLHDADRARNPMQQADTGVVLQLKVQCTVRRVHRSRGSRRRGPCRR